MKKFLSLKGFYEIRFILAFEIIMCGWIYMLLNMTNSNKTFFDWGALFISLAMWILSSTIDSKVYRNLPSLIGFGGFVYIISWLVLNLSDIL